jgi:hypothetical protein
MGNLEVNKVTVSLYLKRGLLCKPDGESRILARRGCSQKSRGTLESITFLGRGTWKA